MHSEYCKLYILHSNILVKTVGFKIEIVNGLERIYLRNISAYLSISERDGCEGRQALLSREGKGVIQKQE